MPTRKALGLRHEALGPPWGGASGLEYRGCAPELDSWRRWEKAGQALEVEVADDVRPDLIAERGRNRRQPGAAVVRVLTPYDVGIPDAKAVAVVWWALVQGRGARQGGRISMQAMPTSRDSGRSE